MRVISKNESFLHLSIQPVSLGTTATAFRFSGSSAVGYVISTKLSFFLAVNYEKVALAKRFRLLFFHVLAVIIIVDFIMIW